jgi:hypothetical protein
MSVTKTKLSDEELMDILENRIPALVDRRPDLYWRIYSSWVNLFAKREEIAAIMEELRHLGDNLTDFRQSTERRFDQIEERQDGTDQRLDKIDQRFEQVDQRFEQVDQRFEQVDQRFEQVDQRFDQVDQRFDQVDQRFDQVDRRFDEMSQSFADLKDWVTLNVGRLQVRAGRSLEDVVAGAMRVALKRPDIQPQSIKLRQKIRDEEGVVFARGKQKEVDLIVSNGEYLVFEVKSAAEVEDVDDFADKVDLVKHLNPNKVVRGVFITLAPEPDVQQRCKDLGIELAR